jgi:hypothetical protein
MPFPHLTAWQFYQVSWNAAAGREAEVNRFPASPLPRFPASPRRAALWARREEGFPEAGTPVR